MAELIDLEGLDKKEVERVKNFVATLKKAKRKEKNRKFNFNWAGGLKGAFGKMSAVELQHKSTEWR